MVEHTYSTGDRVRIVSDGPLGVQRIYDLHHFAPEELNTRKGEEGEVIGANSMPDGWQLVRLDRPDPEPDHLHSDGHLYVPVSPAMIEPA